MPEGGPLHTHSMPRDVIVAPEVVRHRRLMPFLSKEMGASLRMKSVWPSLTGPLQ